MLEITHYFFVKPSSPHQLKLSGHVDTNWKLYANSHHCLCWDHWHL